MHVSTRFAVAVHLLVLAIGQPDRQCSGPVTSQRMAWSIETNPVVLRRILGALREAGLVTSQPGPGGGWRLAIPPEAITLRDIYRAVEEGPLFAFPHRHPNQECLVACVLPQVLATCFQEAEAAMEERLAETTLAEIVAALRAEVGHHVPTDLEEAAIRTRSPSEAISH